jgi:2'-5' RNA ligase
MFIALDLPEEVGSELAAWGRVALADAALRAVPRSSLHITLAFLGHLPEKEIPRLAAIIEGCARGAPSIELADPVPRPERGRPRLYALPAASPGGEELQAGIERRLVEARLYEPERRRFWPHVTVARVRRERRGSNRPARVRRPIDPLPKRLLRPFDGVRVTLYRSELKPQGAQYTPLAQVELPEGRQ